MKMFGYNLSIARIAESINKAQSFNAVSNYGSGWFNILEPFAGAWQRNVTVDGPREILAFSAVYASVTIIAQDIAKLGIDLMHDDENGISVEVKTNSPYLPVLTKPNKFQTWFKFIEQWMVSKLLYGNAYIIKDRDARGIVTAMYVLDSQRVTPLVADNGDIYYQLSRDNLSGLTEPVTIPASEIIHDTMVSLFHPLVGVSPIYACGISATMGNRIQRNSTKFFDNMSRPSGSLTAPGTITDETANRLKAVFEENFSNGNIGRLMVAGDGLTYQPMTITATDAQLIEQLKWTAEDVARCFHIPMYKLGGAEPVRQSVESLNQTYYSDCLQALIESAEALLNDGLGLDSVGYEVEFDLDNLMRMDTAARLRTNGQAVKDGIMAPNEARAIENMPPVAGGESPMLQQQNFSLAALAKRDAKDDPFSLAPSATPAIPSATPAVPALPAPDFSKALEIVIKGLEYTT